jgi:hypothetical protein
MSKIALSPPASGTATFTLSAPATNTDRTLTLPDNSGTVLTTATPGVPVNGPAFSAYNSTATGLAQGVVTKILFQTERFDTASNFDSSRFTPTVAGYYQINANVTISNVSIGIVIIYLRKNGVDYCRGARATINDIVGLPLGDVVYMNGTTDYLEVYALTTGTSTQTEAGDMTYFSGALVRAA